MKNINKHIKIILASLAAILVIAGCNEEKIEPNKEFTDLALSFSTGRSTARESAVNQFYSFMDMSAGGTYREWRIPQGAFFLKGPIPNNLEYHDQFIVNPGDTISTDRTIHVMWTEGDTITPVTYYAEFEDSTSFIFPSYWDTEINQEVNDTISTVFEGGKWIAEYTFTIDVYDTVAATPKIMYMDQTEIDYENTASIELTFGDTLLFEDYSAFVNNNNSRPDNTVFRLHTTEENEDDRTYVRIFEDFRDGDYERRVMAPYVFEKLGEYQVELTATRDRTEQLRANSDTYSTPMIIKVVPKTTLFEIEGDVVELDGDVIEITLNDKLANVADNFATNFTVEIDGSPVTVSSVSKSSSSAKKLIVTLETPLVPEDAGKSVTISYDGANALLTSLDERPLQAFTDVAIDVYVPPVVASFTMDMTEIDQGQTITFTNTSEEDPDTYMWTFEGGTPATSTDENPTVTYAEPGLYDVTLVVTRSGDGSTDTMVMEDVILVKSNNLIFNAGTASDFESGSGWSIIEGIDAANVAYTTAAGAGESIVSLTVPMGGDLSGGGVLSSNKISSIPAGDYVFKTRFRSNGGGSEAAGGALEIRAYIQDHATFTPGPGNDANTARQIMGVFKLGGISTAATTDIWNSAVLTDSDTDDNWADSDEWVEVEVEFTVPTELTDHAVKFQVRVGAAHAATEDAVIELDYFELVPAK
ncbi:PKD domain-containing protein [Flammeovirgaceae bacterium SG7u.111]|nr:PKD domain-containing protein [Flammeovirgaceae bacterium SG7u.132]WPO37604.1 PKD domain-containing protein [Flammeovirgaceae bacterium SG7u.111]